MRSIKIQDSIHTFLYGRLTITNNTSHIETYNICWFKLGIGTSRLTNVYYDGNYGSFDALIRDEPIEGGKSVEHSVYWAFNGKVQNNDIQILREVFMTNPIKVN